MARRKKLRRAGSPWRILVHEYLGGWPKYGVAHNVASDSTFGGGDGTDSEWCKHIELPGTEFDELVVGNWIHLEQMDTGTWWLNVGGITLWVRADRDGQPIRVDVYGPDDYAYAVEGCKYQCVWSRDEKERP